jgi:hypothetical protein
MIKLNQLLKEETFTATNKASGKTSVFKTKDSRDAAIKAGTHDAIKGKEQPSAPKVAGSDMFGGDYAKDRGGDTPKTDAGNEETPKYDLGVDSVVYNKRTKTVGIVRMGDERGETKTDADGNVNTDELEPYNPMKFPYQKDAQVAPSTSKEIESRKLFNPFSQKNDPKKINNPTEALPKEIYAKMDNEDSDAGEMDYLSSTDGSIKYGIAKEGNKYYVTLGTEEGEILKSFGKTKDAGEAAQIFMKNLDAVKSKYNLDVDTNESIKKEGTIKLTKLMENDPCWKGYKQVGMKDKNGREVPNCVPESVVKEAGIPKLYLKIEAVKNKIKALEAERKSKYGGEYARKLNAETDPKRKHELAQPIFAITKQITMYQKNLLKMMDDEEKYYANMGKDDELDPNFA